jgi:acetate CoA/acetoacetate CoA-transferase alpha subunit
LELACRRVAEVRVAFHRTGDDPIEERGNLRPHLAERRQLANEHGDDDLARVLTWEGTLIERIRAGGFGLGGILTATGLGTVVEQGKQKVAVDGKDYLVEPALRADFALVNAFMADYLGNLAYALTGRNFNPVIAMAADTVIVAAENIVPVGVIPPDHVVTPAAIVDYLITQR